MGCICSKDMIKEDGKKDPKKNDLNIVQIVLNGGSTNYTTVSLITSSSTRYPDYSTALKLDINGGSVPMKKSLMELMNETRSSPEVRFTGKENKKVVVKAPTLPPNSQSARGENLGPFFDPKKFEETKKKKNVVLTTGQNSNKYPNAVVIYTTTLRGIPKTFEDCNMVRGILESHHVCMMERDVSLDSGFKEELRALLGKKEVKVPVVVVKGRLIGGSEEIMKLEEEGKLGILLDGIPKMLAEAAGCNGCGGVRFMVCRACNGSSKLIGDDGKMSVKCVECNENGLVKCPVCTG